MGRFNQYKDQVKEPEVLKQKLAKSTKTVDDFKSIKIRTSDYAKLMLIKSFNQEKLVNLLGEAIDGLATEVAADNVALRHTLIALNSGLHENPNQTSIADFL
jgi:hypothetical protein